MRPSGVLHAHASPAHSTRIDLYSGPLRAALQAARGAMCILLALAAPASAGERIAYDIDPVHTRVLLAVDHAGFSKALGTVSGTTGRLWFDEEDWASAVVDATIPVARLDFGDETWNRATLARNLLDAERYPQARFVSTRIEPLGEGRARVHGMLTLHGVSRDVALEAVLNAAKRHPLPPFRRTVGFSATAVLSRSDFGVDAWPRVIGDAVELRIELEATRSRDQDDAPDAAPAAPAASDTAAPAAQPATPEADRPAPAPAPGTDDSRLEEARP